MGALGSGYNPRHVGVRVRVRVRIRVRVRGPKLGG